MENELEIIAEDLAQRFPRTTAFTRPIRQKLARAIHRRERCEAVRQRACLVMQSPAWQQANPQQQAEFLHNLQKTKTRIAELSGLIHRFTAVLVQNENCFFNHH